MSESNHETDRKNTDVAIAAESNLDREGAEGGDGSDGSVSLIMSALEKMASVTDQLAQQMNERLDGVERDIDENRTYEDSDQLLHRKIAGSSHIDSPEQCYEGPQEQTNSYDLIYPNSA